MAAELFSLLKNVYVNTKELAAELNYFPTKTTCGQHFSPVINVTAFLPVVAVGTLLNDTIECNIAF